MENHKTHKEFVIVYVIGVFGPIIPLIMIGLFFPLIVFYLAGIFYGALSMIVSIVTAIIATKIRETTTRSHSRGWEKMLIHITELGTFTATLGFIATFVFIWFLVAN